jgi:hypothetical protein
MDLVDIFESGVALSEFAYNEAEYDSARILKEAEEE